MKTISAFLRIFKYARKRIIALSIENRKLKEQEAARKAADEEAARKAAEEEAVSQTSSDEPVKVRKRRHVKPPRR